METRGEGRARAARLTARAETPKSSAQTQLGNLPPSREDSTHLIQCQVAESPRSMDRGDCDVIVGTNRLGGRV